jgi:hypothetical protein
VGEADGDYLIVADDMVKAAINFYERTDRQEAECGRCGKHLPADGDSESGWQMSQFCVISGKRYHAAVCRTEQRFFDSATGTDSGLYGCDLVELAVTDDRVAQHLGATGAPAFTDVSGGLDGAGDLHQTGEGPGEGGCRCVLGRCG